MGDTKNGGNDASVAGEPESPPDYGDVLTETGEDAIIPKGQVDPVFERKARVLNRAVR